MANGNGLLMKVAAGVGVVLVCSIAGLVVSSWSGHASEDVVAKHIEKSDTVHKAMTDDCHKRHEETRQVVVEIQKAVSNIDTNLAILLEGYRGGK